MIEAHFVSSTSDSSELKRVAKCVGLVLCFVTGLLVGSVLILQIIKPSPRYYTGYWSSFFNIATTFFTICLYWHGKITDNNISLWRLSLIFHAICIFLNWISAGLCSLHVNYPNKPYRDMSVIYTFISFLIIFQLVSLLGVICSKTHAKRVLTVYPAYVRDFNEDVLVAVLRKDY
ncbi:hypothetical protein Ciccas_001561 [Cichlidogyrus casuarinus]|uniref:Uncharacterized protein n=1 Tax=Cichlidogyrus casuarinus TaxID=1844966 RepID=A0ABD2QK17_9PLAT